VTDTALATLEIASWSEAGAATSGPPAAFTAREPAVPAVTTQPESRGAIRPDRTAIA
jgi:hypothetical protein